MDVENLNNDMIPVGTTVHINPEDIKWECNDGDLIRRERPVVFDITVVDNIYITVLPQKIIVPQVMGAVVYLQQKC